jgi:hypothetical protein
MSLSSISFAGNASSYITVPNSEELQLGTGDFTIEWYQYQTDDSRFPRVFEIGAFNTNSVGVSIEGAGGVSLQGTFYYWKGSQANPVITLNNYKSVWVHFAISRNNNTIRIFMNGNLIGTTISDARDIRPTGDLTIANQLIKGVYSTAFGGQLMYLSIKKGEGKYTENFIVSDTYPTDSTILIAGDYLYNSVPTNVTTSTNIPPNFNGELPPPPTPPPPPPPPPTPVPRPVVRYYMPLFTNNSQVYYKSNSLPSCGVGSVRNSRFKAKRT